MASPVLRKKRTHETEEKLPEPETRLIKKTNAAAAAAISPPPSPSRLGPRTFHQVETAPTSFLMPGFSRPPKRAGYSQTPSPIFSISPSSAFKAIKPRPPAESEDEELVRLLSNSSITPFEMRNRCQSPTPDLEGSPSHEESSNPLPAIWESSPPPSTTSDTSYFSPIRPT